MKRLCFGILLGFTLLGGDLASAQSPLFDHLRAFAQGRLPVGDPASVVTNNYGGDLDGPKDVAVADLDGDGHQDFAAAGKDGSITVYFGLGDGSFDAPLYLRTWTTA